MADIPVFFLHGLAYASLLFLVSSGLTLVFGLMNVLNFAHATFYMLGAYFSYSIFRLTGQFWLSLLLCPLLLGILGALVERFLLRRVHRYGHLHELLLTFGVAYVITELVKFFWGNYALSISLDGFLTESVSFLSIEYPIYRLFIIACAVIVGLLMYLVIYRTRVGIIVRAAVNDSQMVDALGINVQFVFMSVFAVGAALSGFAGVIAGPLLTTYPGMASDILIDAFVVIVVGGFGSLGGAMLSSIIIGELQSFGVLLFPSLALALVYLLMAIVLIVKPSGLFGVEQS
jgi:branched-chain amino acid transport system permease protein